MPILNPENIRLGSTAIVKAMLGSAQIWPPVSPGLPVWEDFETGNRMIGTSRRPLSDWNRVDEGDKSPQHVMSYTGPASHAQIYQTVTTYSASPTFLLECRVRMNAGGTNLAGPAFGKQSSGNFDGYTVILDTRNRTGGTAGLQLRLNNGTSPLAWQAIAINVGEWYRVQMEWRTSGTRITVRLYSDSPVANSLLATITSTNSAYTSGFLGLHAYNPASFDDIKLSE